jgi:hypothetical protein
MSRHLKTESSEVGDLTVGTVYYDLGTMWDEEHAVRTAVMDLIDFAPVAFEVDGLDVLELISIGPFTDAYGNTEDEVAFKLTITRETSDKVNWEGVDPHNIGYILDVNEGCGAYVHPALQSAWLAYQLE